MSITDREDQLESFRNFNAEGNPIWMISTAWLKVWKSGKIKPGVLPTDEKYDILCEHGIPTHREATYITEDALLILRTAVGDFKSWHRDTPHCEECSERENLDQIAEAEWRSLLTEYKPIRRDLESTAHSFDTDYYAVPFEVYRRFQEWYRFPGPVPDLKIGLCEHGGIDFDPMLEHPKYLSEIGWRAFCEK